MYDYNLWAEKKMETKYHIYNYKHTNVLLQIY